jgi:hypothetical protein
MEGTANWMGTATSPFHKGSWIVCSGRVLGVLDRELIEGPQPVDSTIRILVILPDDWEFVRQGTLSAQNPCPPKGGNPSNKSPATPKTANPGGIASRNPISTPIRGRKTLPQTQSSPATSPRKDADQETMEERSADTDHTDNDSHTDQLLEDQLASRSTTPTRKRKEQTSPQPVRNKRSTAGKKNTRLYD